MDAHLTVNFLELNMLGYVNLSTSHIHPLDEKNPTIFTSE